MTIQYNPGTYYSAHSDLLFTVYDVKSTDGVTYPDYKYIADVYVGAVKVVTLKAVPRPDNKIGIFNIGPVVRNYVAATFNPTANAILCQTMGSLEFFVSVTVKFGEDYDFVTYSNILTDSARVYFNHYNGRLLGQNTSLTAYADKPLTTRPAITPLRRDSAFNFIPFLPSDTDNVTVTIKTYNYADTLAQTINLTVTPAAANTLQQLNLSRNSINANTPGAITDYIKYFTVLFTTPNISDDVTLRFDLTCEGIYEVYSIHFLNKFGGWETRDFTKVSRKTIEIDKQEFGKLGYTMDSSGVISYKNSNNVYNETRSVYASQYKEKMTLNTDILTDAEYTWLAELILSPQVYVEMGGYFIPVNIIGNNYEFKKVIVDELTNLTINVEWGDTFNAQFR